MPHYGHDAHRNVELSRQSRAAEHTARTVRAQLNDAREASRADTARSWLAIALAGFALVASLGAYRLAFEDDAGDRKWRREQQRAAEEQRVLLRAILDELRMRPTSDGNPTR